jgi:NAD(P)-dependent dehydrogenase (short-subunit alcohol dehydrogenase family)
MSSTEPNTNFDPSPFLSSLPQGGVALVIGASGGIGSAFMGHLQENKQFSHVLGLSRSSHPALDLSSEATIAAAADTIRQSGQVPRLIILATGTLHEGVIQPEKGWRDLDPDAMARSFAVNTIGPALVMKHFLPLLPREGKSVFAALSAKVGSIGDNRLGGWHSYRASKAALNQMIRTMSIELHRRAPEALCVSLHPGTVATRMSAPFTKSGLNSLSPEESALRLLQVVDQLTPEQTGGFFDYRGEALPW